MANPQWPAGLPDLVERQGYREGLKAGAIATRMDSGRKKRRRRFTNTPSDIDIPLKMTLAEKATFYSFWDNDIAFGALPFDWVRPSDSTNVTFAFREPQRPSFIEPEPGAKLWRIVLQLEILP